MGNCEESVGNGSLDCGCGFPEDSACNAYSINWYAYVMKQLVDCPHLQDWCRQMPRRIELTVGNRRLAVVHGSPRFISEFVWPSSSDDYLLDEMALLPAHIDGVICGHSGIPFARLIPDGAQRQKLWLNAGVIGMPANDGTQRGWYALLSAQQDGSVKVSIRCLSFDAKSAANAIYSEPSLNRGYADALVSGIWPSHDVLPLTEQMSTGVPVAESELVWPPDKVIGGHARAMASPILAVAVAVAAIAGAWWMRSRRGASL
eukprot:gnl/TRDRNA2_/TRDRNA2_162729_c0_seq2.p1 gnl/TRDRNA2_/TRDRNA2_162729_c0~~gnl/TRDRNA2_/TRDRNA2_162729_c0_seq2.p1  ORF type:complete len:300 (+),score=37.32 gnl/TRDRNA2_/TRDRNA2_162729_c0_seq2:122-901(+)